MLKTRSLPSGRARRGAKTPPHGVAEAVVVPQSRPGRGFLPFAETAAGQSKPDRARTLSYLGVFHATPLERISMIKHGIPAANVKRMFDDLSIGQGAGFKALNLPTATVNKKAKTGDVLSREESERVIGLARLVGQLEAMVEESGDRSGFDACAWMARWLTEPLPAFGGVRPVDLIDTMEGQGLVSSALARLQSGAYA